MSAAFAELDYCQTALGTLSLQRRLPGDEPDVYEIKLDDAFLMSNRFTAAEVALAHRLPRSPAGPRVREHRICRLHGATEVVKSS